jgi:hypothetical protein
VCAWQGGPSLGGGGGALSDAEREDIVAAARTETAVGGAQGSRFFEEPYELKIGRRQDAARGLGDRMRVDQAAFLARMSRGLDGIEEEARDLGTAEDAAELQDIVDYVINRRTSEKAYPNGIRDQGRSGVRPSHFTSHAIAQEAGLLEPEVHALRIYTTFAYKKMNDPLRDDARYARHEPAPLPVVSQFASDGIKKLRGLRSGSAERNIVVWRGMRNMRATEAFMRDGGTEPAFMSTTTDPRVAVRYALSPHSLLFKIVAPNFMAFGAELQWLSAFPAEAEVLFPPLTFLQPTGRTDRVDAVDRDGRPVAFTVIEVTPYISV